MIQHIRDLPKLPEVGESANKILAEISQLSVVVKREVSAKIRAKPDMFPASLGLDIWRNVSALNPNVGGVHYNSANLKRNSPWDAFRDLERQVIAWFSDLYCAERNQVFGYLTTGSSEGNLMGIWAARNAFRVRSPDQRIALLFARNAHHSIHKAADILDFIAFETMPDAQKTHHIVDLDADYRMCTTALETCIKFCVDSGISQIVVVGSIGTTAVGALDPISEISDVLGYFETTQGVQSHLHLDAAIGGLITPFTTDNRQMVTDFTKTPRIATITCDAHKLGALPYNAGVFLGRSKLLVSVERDANYTASGVDATVTGSRSGAMSAALWGVMRSKGRLGMKKEIETTLHNATIMRDLLNNHPVFDPVGRGDLNVVGAKLIESLENNQQIQSILLANGVFPDKIKRHENDCVSSIYPFYSMPDTNFDTVKTLLNQLRSLGGS